MPGREGRDEAARQDNHGEGTLSSPVRPARTGLVVSIAGPGAVPGAPAVRIASLFAAGIAAAAAAPGSGPAADSHAVAEVRLLAGGRGRLPGVRWRLTDVGSPEVAAALTGSDVLVWVAARTDLQAQAHGRPTDRRAALLRTGRALVVSAAALGVGHVVVVTSAEVFGALPDNPVPLPDDAPLSAVVDEGAVGDLLAVEAFVEESRVNHHNVRFTVLRPAVLVGEGVDTALTRYFEAPRLLAVRGARPTWQFCHLDDLASAVRRVVTLKAGPSMPVATVGCQGHLDLGQVEQLTAMRRIEVGETTATATAAQLYRVGVLRNPASELAYVMHPWAVGSSTLRAHGWQPAYDNETCLGVLLEAIADRHARPGHRFDRPDRRDAALGAASAGVALVATAALLRRARRH